MTKFHRQFVDLAHAHTFPDMTPLPERFYRSFRIEVFTDMYADGDWAVSDSIMRHGIWEPVETAVMCSAFAGEDAGGFIDFGCHVGWYTVLARQWDLPVLAVDASAECLALLERRSDPSIHLVEAWLDEDTEPLRVEWRVPMIVKMDIEGAERHAVRACRSGFELHFIHQALLEMSPVFNDSYPALADYLIGLDYECWVMPEKRVPPPVMDETRRWLTNECRGLHLMSQKDRTGWINDQHQFNAMFCLEEATWG